jgi:hypothetical protein
LRLQNKKRKLSKLTHKVLRKNAEKFPRGCLKLNAYEQPTTETVPFGQALQGFCYENNSKKNKILF